MKIKYYLIPLFFCLIIITFSRLQAGSADTNNKFIQNPVLIDTVKNIQTDTPSVNIQQTVNDTIRDTLLTIPDIDKSLTNTKLFVYILLSAGGMVLFFYIFVLSLFRTFHKTRSSRQAMMLSWSSFFVVSVIWIFIIWGLLAAFWTSTSFVFVMIFLFILSLITALIALKSK
jgi:membrane-associated HD superfamily phosphohydrolase